MTVSTPSYLDVTELAGEPISAEQLDRLYNRYRWALDYCRDKDVAEVACGSGPGLGMLERASKSFEAGDFSQAMVDIVKRNYGDRIRVEQFDAMSLPYGDSSKDVLLIFEALYYVPDVGRFVRECQRVLRPGGKLLIATANKDLPDFNPSPHSHRYLGAAELAEEFSGLGTCRLYGYLDTSTVSVRQKILRPIKAFVVRTGLMPKTMAGKRLLKRLVFGRPTPMPADLADIELEYVPPVPIDAEVADRRHKVIYCEVTKN